MSPLLFLLFISFFIVFEVTRIIFELFSYKIAFMSKFDITLRVIYITSLTLVLCLLIKDLKQINI